MNTTPAWSWRQTSKTSALLKAGIAIATYVATMTALYALTHKVVFTLAFTNSLATTYVIIWRKRHTASPLIARTHKSPINIIVTAMVTVVIYMFATTIATWIKILLNAPSPIQSISGNAPLTAIIILSILVVPIGEEALIRGFVYPVVRQRFSAPVTIALTACVFAFLHGNIVQIVLTLPLGIACGLVYEHTHSLITCIGTHMLFNALTLLPSPFADISTADVNAANAATSIIAIVIIPAILLLSIVIALWQLWMYYDDKC